MGYLVYYLVLKPLSLLPLSVLYGISDIVYFIIYKLAGYRKDVVLENLANAFPEKSGAEQNEIASGFYHYFTDLMVEIVWCFSLSEKRIKKHFKVKNREVLDKFYNDGKSVILILGHYNSFEMVLSSLNLFVKHRIATIYVPLTNKTLDSFFYKMRTTFNSEMIRKKDFSQRIKEGSNELDAIIFGADQSPSISKNIYWTQFLNQDTAVAFGAEKYGKLYNRPVVFTYLTRVRRGYYEAKFETVSEFPQQEADGVITEKHVRLMEKQILTHPQYWLWSHKRWKKKRE